MKEYNNDHFQKHFRYEKYLLVVLFVCIVIVSIELDFSEKLFRFFDNHEEYELDELILSLVYGFLFLVFVNIRKNLLLKKEKKHSSIVEQNLMESQNYLQSIFQSIEDSIFILDKNGVFIQNEHHLGKPNCCTATKEMVGKHFSDVLPPDGAVCIKNYIDNASAHGKPKSFDFHVQYESKIIWHNATITPLRVSDECCQFLLTVRDITDRKKQEAELEKHRDHLDELVQNRTIELVEVNSKLTRESKEKNAIQEKLKKTAKFYKDLFENMHEGFGLVDAQETVIFCNKAYANIFDLEEADDLAGRNLFEFIPDDEVDKIKNGTEERMQGISSRYEVDILTKNGTRKTILVSTTPKLRRDGSFAGTYAAILDISELLELRNNAQKAERLETAGTVAGEVAHDFNNLLSPLIAYPELIISKLAPNDPVIKYIKRMKETALRMADINHQLLTLGRRGYYKQEPLNLNEIILEICSQQKILRDNIVFDIQLENNLLTINGGESQLSRVILNMISNAYDAMTDSGTLSISTENTYFDNVSKKHHTIPSGKYVKLTISDTGEGIDESVIPHIFDAFYSTKKANKKSGSGLGLSVVLAVIEDHNGYIDIESSKGQGTSFYVYFPITCKEVEQNLEQPLVRGNENILVIDNDLTQQEVLGDLLTELGYQVSFATTQEDCFALLNKFSYDLILMENRLNSSDDGIKLFRKILDYNPQQKIVIISGYLENNDIENESKINPNNIIKKPVMLQPLAQILRKQLDSKESIQTSK